MNKIIDMDNFNDKVFIGFGCNHVYFNPIYLRPFDRILGKQELDEPWQIDFFYRVRNDGRISGLVGIYDVAIPYNDYTKHLLGTKLDPPQFFKYWI